MVITKKQKELDVIKWNESVKLGKDACGTFDYCVCCNKSLANPCDKAFKKFNAVAKETATTAVKKMATKKATATKKTTK